MAARSLQRPACRRVYTRPPMALRLIGAGPMVLLDGDEVGKSASTGASTATPSRLLSGTGGAGSGAGTPVERAALAAAPSMRRGRAASQLRHGSPGGARDDRRSRLVRISRP